MRRIALLVAVLAALSGCSTRQRGGTAVIIGMTDRLVATAQHFPRAAERARDAGSASGRKAVAAANRGALPSQQEFAVAGTTGRIEAGTSAESVPAPLGASPGRPADTLEAPPREDGPPDDRSSVLRPVSIAILIAAALLLARRLF